MSDVTLTPPSGAADAADAGVTAPSGAQPRTGRWKRAVPRALQPTPKARQPRPVLPRGLVALCVTLAAFTVTALYVFVYAMEFSALQEQRTQHQLYSEFRGELDPASQVAPAVGGAIPPGTPVAMIEAPSVGVHDLMVVEGTSSSDLLAGPGHLRDSPLPGQPGQSIMMGKSVTAGAPFQPITQLHTGDLLTVRTGQGLFTYKVISERQAGSPLPQFPASGSMLTFVTSVGSGWLGAFEGDSVEYVDAALQGRAVVAPPGRPEAVPDSEVQGRGDPAAWPFIVFWIQALIIAACLVAWLWSKWGRWQVWLVGAPVIFCLMWGLSTEAMRLLPNVV